MNKERRKDLEKAILLLDEASSIIQTAHDEEESAFENLTDALKQTERGQQMESAVSDLDSAKSSIEEGIDYVRNSIQ